MATITKRLWANGSGVTCERHASDDLLVELRLWPSHSVHHVDDETWTELAEVDLIEFHNVTGAWIDCDRCS